MILAWILNGVAVCFVIWAALSVIRQRRKRKTREQSRELVLSSLAGLALGAMMLDFQAIYQPQTRHEIVNMQKEESVDDRCGGESPGGRDFHERLRRIRSGEVVDELTLRTNLSGRYDRDET